MTPKTESIKSRLSLFFILALTIGMLAGFMPGLNINAYADGEGWSSLSSKFEAGGEIKLEDNYIASSADEALVVPEGKTVILDLNGHTIDRGLADADAAETDGNVITVNGTLTIKDTSSDGKGTIKGGWNSDYGGGVIIGNGASLVMESGAISGNKAGEFDGGGVYLDDGAKSFIMNGGVIGDNYASSDGGGVALHDGTFTINGGTISGNTAGEDGGGIFVTDENAVFVMSDEAVVSSNNAQKGGGVFIDHGSFSLENGSIKENTAKDNGGGVYVSGSAESGSVEFNMKAGSIEKNTAENNGGGVSTISDFTMSGGSISGNSADNWGGGIYTEGDLDLSNGTIDKNTSYSRGGGVYFCGDTFDMSGGVIKDNESTDNGAMGGGVFVDSGGEFTMEGDSAIEDNKSGEEGGGVFVYGTLTMDSEDAVISGNETGVRGGGISCDGDGYYVINKGTISNNIAEWEGGGLYVLNSCTMNGGSVTGNEARGTDPGEGGGGVSVSFLPDSVFTMTGGEITGNTAVNQGGGINLERDGTSSGILNLSGNPVITGNKKGEADDNIYLPSGNLITVDGKLGDGTNVGVSMEEAGTFTTGYNGKMADAEPAKFFTSDDTAYSVVKDSTGEAKLGKIDITNVNINIAAPTCGDKISLQDLKYPIGAQPTVQISEDAHCSVLIFTESNTPFAFWGDLDESGKFDELPDSESGTRGVIKGGEEYYAQFKITPDDGYCFNESTKVSVNDNMVTDPELGNDGQLLIVSGPLTAIHAITEVEAKAATCTEDGNVAYWKCSGCNTCFKDETCTEEMTETEIVVKATGHQNIVKIEAKDATDTEDGCIEHYTCKDCGTNFSDEEGTKELSDDDVVIPKTGPSGGDDAKPGSTVSIKNAKVVLSASSFAYNGKVRKPSIKTIGGKALKSGTDYTVKWSNTSSKNVGSYTVTITGKGNYIGTTKATYKINPKKATLKKPVKARKAITVKWKRQAAKMSKTRITGYQIQLATNKTFTKNKKTVNVKGYKKVSKKVKKLKAKKKYYIRIRTYKTVSGKKYYSGWSKVKAIKTK